MKGREIIRSLTGETGRKIELAQQLMVEAEKYQQDAQVLDPRREIEYTPEERAAYTRGKASGTLLAIDALLREEG